MKFGSHNFTSVQPGFHRFDWEKSKEEKVSIFVRAATDVELEDTVKWAGEFVERETGLRKAAVERIYPSEASWLGDECELASAEALLSALRWTILDIGELEGGGFHFRLVYAGPNDFQTLTAKHVLMVAATGSGDDEWDAFFESYNES